MTISYDKRISQIVLHGHVNYDIFQEYETVANKRLSFIYEGVQE